MPGKKPAFVIDDSRSVEDNLTQFIELMNREDSELGRVLGKSLLQLSEGSVINPPELWDELYEATAASSPTDKQTKAEAPKAGGTAS